MTIRDLSFRAPPALAVAENATTPSGVVGTQIWSTTASKLLTWDGSKWYAPSGGSGGMVGQPMYIQETDPMVASPYIWYKTDPSGNVVDILKG